MSLPFGDDDRYDLVVDDGGALHRIQCKTAWTRRGDPVQHALPADERLYWIDANEATDQKMELRFDAAIDHPSINWASDYEFDGTILLIYLSSARFACVTVDH